jgi:cystathionine gamma-synthase
MASIDPRWSPASIAVHGVQGGDPATGAISTPIYQSATFCHPALGETTGWDYSRQGNPTRSELEATVALLEGGSSCFAFSTGMAALCAVLDLLSSGDEAILCEDLYGGTWRLFNELARQRGISFTLVDTRSVAAVEAACTKSTRLILVESPSNPMARISDIAAIAEIARKRKILFAVDNTFLTPLFQRPLALGADLVIHSGSKFLAGHNDTLAGFLVPREGAHYTTGEGNSIELSERLALIQKTTGAVLAPFDSWLVLRGIKTLSLRVRSQEASALSLAQFLKGHPSVQEVYYPGLEDHPQYEVSKRQSSGFGSMISFRVKDGLLWHRFSEGTAYTLCRESRRC